MTACTRLLVACALVVALLPASHAQTRQSSGAWSTLCSGSTTGYCSASNRVKAVGGLPYRFQLNVSRGAPGADFEIALLAPREYPGEGAAITVQVDGRKIVTLAPGEGYRRAGRSHTYLIAASETEKLLAQMRRGQRVVFQYQDTKGGRVAAAFSLAGLGKTLVFMDRMQPAPRASAPRTAASPARPAPVEDVKTVPPKQVASTPSAPTAAPTPATASAQAAESTRAQAPGPAPSVATMPAPAAPAAPTVATTPAPAPVPAQTAATRPTPAPVVTPTPAPVRAQTPAATPTTAPLPAQTAAATPAPTPVPAQTAATKPTPAPVATPTPALRAQTPAATPEPAPVPTQTVSSQPTPSPTERAATATARKPGAAQKQAAITAAPSASRKRGAKSIRQFSCRGNEPFWTFVIDNDSARYSTPADAGQADAVEIKGKLNVTGDGPTPVVDWRGKSDWGGSFRAMVTEQTCRDSMSDAEGQTEFEYRARVTLPGGKTVEGCCNPGLPPVAAAAPADATQYPVADVRARPETDWSHYLFELLPAIQACIDKTPEPYPYATKAWPMNRGMVGVRTRNRGGGWFECVAESNGRSVDRFVPLPSTARPAPNEDRVVFSPPDQSPPEGNCFKHERVMDGIGDFMGWLSTNGCS